LNTEKEEDFAYAAIVNTLHRSSFSFSAFEPARVKTQSRMATKLSQYRCMLTLTH